MSAADNKAVVEQMWRLFAVSEWDEAGKLLADDFVASWVHSGEVFHGRDNFLSVQRYYPPVGWRIEPQRFIAEGDTVVAEIHVPEDTADSYVVSIAELQAGKIRKLTEYWVTITPENAPEWREQYAEKAG